MNVYLDTSAVLRVLLAQGKPLDGWGKWEAAWASELMGLEVRRVVFATHDARQATAACALGFECRGG